MAFLGAIPTNPAPRPGAVDGRGKRARLVKAGEHAGSGAGSDRDPDEAMLTSVEAVDLARTVAGPAANDSEDGHEDRAQHGAYAPDRQPLGPRANAPGRPRIDLRG